MNPISNLRTTMPDAAVLSENYPTAGDAQAFKAFFEREGFIVVRNGIPRDLCEAAKRSFLAEVLPDSSSLFLRHESGRYEPHVFTEAGFMKYPIMNIQDISEKRYPRFKQLGLDLLTQPAIQRAMHTLFGEPGRLIHTMYFDGNQVTWAHRDAHYLDSNPPGRVVGVWVAVEDIRHEAGRFYTIRGSHRMAIPDEDDDPNGTTYKDRMAQFVRNHSADCIAPALTQGDMLLWTGQTIHGSLPTADQRYSRRSFTAHYVPQSLGFQWRGSQSSPSEDLIVNDVAVTLTARGVAGHIKNTLLAYPGLYGIIRKIKRGRSST